MKAFRKKSWKTRETPARKKLAMKRGRSGVKVRTLLVRSWWVLRGAAAGTLILALLYAGYVGVEKVISSPSLTVRIIKVEGCRGIDPDSVVRLSGTSPGDPLLKVDLKKVRDRVLTHPAIRDASVVRKLPDTIRIAIEERTPAAALLGRDFALVDKEGVVIARSAAFTDNYPVITGVAPIPEPGQVAPEAAVVLGVMKEMISSGLTGGEGISELNVSEKRILVSLAGSGTVLVLPRENARAALARLVRLMESGFFDARAPGYDLRFEGRVVALPERTGTGKNLKNISLAGGKSNG
jgi:cell division septal protein FtsQ